MRLFYLKCKRRLLTVQIDNLELLLATKGIENPKLRILIKELKELDDEIYDLMYRGWVK